MSLIDNLKRAAGGTNPPGEAGPNAKKLAERIKKALGDDASKHEEHAGLLNQLLDEIEAE